MGTGGPNSVVLDQGARHRSGEEDGASRGVRITGRRTHGDGVPDEAGVGEGARNLAGTGVTERVAGRTRQRGRDNAVVAEGATTEFGRHAAVGMDCTEFT